jgi:uncharacterized coiled-coil protein SlyX
MNSHLSSALALDAQLEVAREKIRKLEAKVAQQKDVIATQDKCIRGQALAIAGLRRTIRDMAERYDNSRNRNDGDLVHGNGS